MSENATPHIKIRIQSQPRYACVVRSAVETATRLFGLCERDCGRVMLCVDEAVTNVIRHGYKGKTDRPIHVSLYPIEQDGKEGIQIVIEDECEGVDLSTIKSRPLEEIRPGGLGVHIIQDIMNSVQYSHRKDGRGVRLEMTKLASA